MERKCSDCNIIKDISNYRKSGKDKNGNQKYKYRCKECMTDYERAYKKRYRDTHKEEIREYSRLYEKNRKSTDGIFKLKRNIRSLISHSFSNVGYKKNTKTERILGCELNHFIQYIEKQFTDGMSWDNYGEWHVDHIKPLMVANTEEEVLQLNHYTNLQPLWSKDNLDKRSSDRYKWS